MFGLFRETESPKTRFLICQAGGDFEIVGESHYQTALERLAGGKKPDGVEVDTGAFLIPEPANPYDRNAVKVEIDGQKVGHLALDDTATFHRALRQYGAEQAFCAARIVGGWDRGAGDIGSFGVKLNLTWPPNGKISER